MKDLSKPGDRRRQVEEMRAAEARLENLLQMQWAKREELRRQGAADALFGYGGDLGLGRQESMDVSHPPTTI